MKLCCIWLAKASSFDDSDRRAVSAVDPPLFGWRRVNSLRVASFRVSVGVVFLFGCARAARGFGKQRA